MYISDIELLAASLMHQMTLMDHYTPTILLLKVVGNNANGTSGSWYVTEFSFHLSRRLLYSFCVCSTGLQRCIRQLQW